jgi:peptidoglycan/LPS O-acetylase OafA/YrhL
VRLPDQGDLALFAIFAQNYSRDTILTFNPVTWTLCLEVLFYVLLPALGLLAYRWGAGRARRQALVLLGLIALGIAWNAGVYAAGADMVAAKALPAYLPYFSFGMLLALWMERRQARSGRGPRAGPLATLALVLVGFGGVIGNSLWHCSALAGSAPLLTAALQNTPAGLGFAALLAAVVAGRGPGTAWLRARPLAKVGLVSYGVYLWHLPLMLFGNRLGLLPHAFLPRLATVLVPALAAGAVSWFLVERTMLALAGRASRRRTTPRRRISTALEEARAAP